MLEIEACKKRQLHIGYIDPAPEYVRAFKERVHHDGLDSLVQEIFQGPFQDYRPRGRYDRVIAIHSWYAFGFDKQLLEKALSCVNPGGMFFLTVVSKSSATWKLAELARGVRGENLSAEALSEWAYREGFPHRYVTNHKIIPEDEFVTEKGVTEKGKMFASFLMCTPWSDMSTTLQRKVFEVLDGERNQHAIVLKCGCLFFTVE